MRSFAPIALVASFCFAAGLDAQSLTEHAAAAAGATIGTAAGKPLGTALGNIFGKLDKDTSQAAGAKTPKKVEKPAAPEPAKAATSTSSASGSSLPALGSSSPSAPSEERSSSAPRWQGPRATQAPMIFAAAPPAAPPMREPSAADLASIKVGASGQELQSSLGVPESRVTIPGDDGRLLESCQYWAHGQQVGTVQLVNGQVVSVQSNSN